MPLYSAGLLPTKVWFMMRVLTLSIGHPIATEVTPASDPPIAYTTYDGVSFYFIEFWNYSTVESNAAISHAFVIEFLMILALSPDYSEFHPSSLNILIRASRGLLYLFLWLWLFRPRPCLNWFAWFAFAWIDFWMSPWNRTLTTSNGLAHTMLIDPEVIAVRIFNYKEVLLKSWLNVLQ